jgi:hypothetical protein
LSEAIRTAVSEERYVVGQHASERLEERGIMELQVVAEREIACRTTASEAKSGYRVSAGTAGWNGIHVGLVILSEKQRGETGDGPFH